MTKEVTTTPTKDDFLKFVDERLKSIGFVKDSEKNLWALDRDVRVGGGVMVVNGRRMENRGEIHHIVFSVEEVGEGGMKEVEKEIEEGFVEIEFYVIENGERQDLTPTMCMYFDDQNEFNMVLNNVLRM